MEPGLHSTDPHWPCRVQALCAQLACPEFDNAKIRTELWIILRDCLFRYLRCYAAQIYRAPREDLEDVASAKALDLLRRAESGVWKPGGRSPCEIAGYVAAAARNGLLDLAERNGRTERLEPDRIELSPQTLEWLAQPEPPGAVAETHEFVAALKDCVARLDPRRRRIWFLRVLHDMSSRDIAAHPDVQLTAAHVDVDAQRARDAIKKCLGSKGFEPRDLSSLVFVELWNWLETLEDVEATTKEPARHEP
jgi:RNA polymerase sigma factor (sigma-70 family)